MIEAMKPYAALYMGGMGAKEANFHKNVFERMGYGAITGQGNGQGGREHGQAVGAQVARTAAAQQAVGAMQVALETTAGYLNSREQFGVPLKRFQALTFRAADLYVAVELARSLALWAAMVHADPDTSAEERTTAATRAWAQASKAGRLVGQEAIQLHGGIGVTAEYPIAHYAARLTAIENTFGSTQDQLHVLIGQLGDYEVVSV